MLNFSWSNREPDRSHADIYALLPRAHVMWVTSPRSCLDHVAGYRASSYACQLIRCGFLWPIYSATIPWDLPTFATRSQIGNDDSSSNLSEADEHAMQRDVAGSHESSRQIRWNYQESMLNELLDLARPNNARVTGYIIGFVLLDLVFVFARISLIVAVR